MSCSDIQVTILGDITDITKLVDRAEAAATTADTEAQRATSEADRAVFAAQRAETAPVNLATQKEGVAVGSQANVYNFVGSGVQVERYGDNAYRITVPGLTGPTDIADITGLQSALNDLQNRKADDMQANLDHDNKTLELKLLSNGNVIKTDLVDLSPLFGTTVATAEPIYYGFSASNVMTLGIVTAGSSKSVKTINGLNLDLTRSDIDLKYIYLWVPDVFGDIAGLRFSGTFTDVWQSTALNVNGKDGKVYVSDNPTTATDVTFEVIQ